MNWGSQGRFIRENLTWPLVLKKGSSLSMLQEMLQSVPLGAAEATTYWFPALIHTHQAPYRKKSHYSREQQKYHTPHLYLIFGHAAWLEGS